MSESVASAETDTILRAARALIQLADKPEPGLASWQEAFSHAFKILVTLCNRVPFVSERLLTIQEPAAARPLQNEIRWWVGIDANLDGVRQFIPGGQLEIHIHPDALKALRGWVSDMRVVIGGTAGPLPPCVEAYLSGAPVYTDDSLGPRDWRISFCHREAPR